MKKKLLLLLFISSFVTASYELPKTTVPSLFVVLDFNYEHAAQTKITAYEMLLPQDTTDKTVFYSMTFKNTIKTLSKTTCKLVPHFGAVAMLKGDVEIVRTEVAVTEQDFPKEKAEQFTAAIQKCSLFAQYARLTDKAKSTWAYEGNDNPLVTSWNTKRVDAFRTGPHANAQSYSAAHADQQQFVMHGHLPGNRPGDEPNSEVKKALKALKEYQTGSN